MDAQQAAHRLKNFLDGEGRLVAYPSKLRMRKLALCYLATKFEREKRYTEQEINELLKQWHTFGDWPLLRRDLYDLRFLGRERDGSAYWLEDPQPDFPELEP